MPKRAVLAALLAAACASGPAEERPLAMDGPWVRAVAGGVTTTAAYGVIRNASTAPERLLAVRSPQARAAEIHVTGRESGLVSMQHVHGLEVPPGGSVDLVPGGAHIMLIGLHRDLPPDGFVTLELVFESGRTLTVHAPVLFDGSSDLYH